MATGDPLQQGLDLYGGALASGNMAMFQEMIRQFNLNYANSVAQLYGQNYGPGVPAPTTASTLAAGQATGSIGYIPGFTGLDAGQTQSNLATQAGTAQNAGQLTGFYAAPAQSLWSPGTFLRIDPNTYDYATHGDQLDYVTSSGQLQRVSLPQARAMGWDGNLSKLNTAPFETVARLEQAPPTQLPQQTLQGQTTYSNLNTAAQNQAIAQAGVTGMYTAPATMYAPGTDLFGHTFQQLDQATQQAYYARFGDWNAAMQQWVNDSNAGITKYFTDRGQPVPNQAGTPTETLAAQNQYFTQAAQLATQFGQYYTPGMPGQAGVAGVNMPQQGQQTLANIAQQNAIKQAWAQLYGYVPQFDANGQPIFQTGAGGETLAAQEQAYSQQLRAIQAAAALQANPFRQAQVMGQLGGVLGGQNVAGFGGLGQATGQTDFSGMGNMQRLIDDIRGGPGAVNSQTTSNVLNAIPTPNKLDSVNFFRSSPGTQNLVLTGMQEKYGLAPEEALAQIKNTLPAFSSPTTFGGIKR